MFLPDPTFKYSLTTWFLKTVWLTQEESGASLQLQHGVAELCDTWMLEPSLPGLGSPTQLQAWDELGHFHYFLFLL